MNIEIPFEIPKQVELTESEFISSLDQAEMDQKSRIGKDIEELNGLINLKSAYYMALHDGLRLKFLQEGQALYFIASPKIQAGFKHERTV